MGEIYGLHLVDVKAPIRLLEKQDKKRCFNLFDDSAGACVKLIMA